jgi:hypothetical protein
VNESEQERIEKVLKQSLLPIASSKADDRTELSRDLWPAMLKRLQAPSPQSGWFNLAWLDAVLLAAVVIWLAFFPAAIPVLLYHL